MAISVPKIDVGAMPESVSLRGLKAHGISILALFPRPRGGAGIQIDYHVTRCRSEPQQVLTASSCARDSDSSCLLGEKRRGVMIPEDVTCEKL